MSLSPSPRRGRILRYMPVSVMCENRKLFFMNQEIPLEGGRETKKKFETNYLAPAV